jgi:hypothetical protein
MSLVSSTLISLSYKNTITLGSILRSYPLLYFGGIIEGIILTSSLLLSLLYSELKLESSRLRLLSLYRNSFIEVK